MTSLARLDFIQASRSSLLRAALAVFVLLMAMALWSGAREQTRWQTAVDATRGETERVLAREQENVRLQRQEGFQPPGAPAAQSVDASLPRAPGVVLALGDAGLRPISAAITTSTRADSMFKNVETGSALSASLGSFDPTWIVIVLLPLFIIAFGHDLLAADRDASRLGLLRAQSRNLGAIVWRRLALLLLVMEALITPTAVVAVALGASLTTAALWWLIANLYVLLWGLITTLGSVRARSSQASATALLLVWLVVVIILPASVSFVADRVAPVTSRLSHVIHLREAQLDLQQQSAQLMDKFLTDHPELAGASRSGFARTSFVMQRETEARLAPLLEKYDAEREKRAQWKQRLSVLSPSMATHEALTHVTGTGGARNEAFVDQAIGFAKTWRDHLRERLFLDHRLSAEELAALPRFRFEESTASPRALWAACYLLGLIGVFGLAVQRSLRSAELR